MNAAAALGDTSYRHVVGERDGAVLRQAFEAYLTFAVVERIDSRPDTITEAG